MDERDAKGFACSHQGFCFANSSSLFIPGNDHRSSGAWQTGSPQRHLCWCHMTEKQRARDQEPSSLVRSRFFSKELSETVYWLELLVDAGIVSQARLAELLIRRRRADGYFCGFSKDSQEREVVGSTFIHSLLPHVHHSLFIIHPLFPYEYTNCRGHDFSARLSSRSS